MAEGQAQSAMKGRTWVLAGETWCGELVIIDGTSRAGFLEEETSEYHPHLGHVSRFCNLYALISDLHGYVMPRAVDTWEDA